MSRERVLRVKGHDKLAKGGALVRNIKASAWVLDQDKSSTKQIVSSSKPCLVVVNFLSHDAKREILTGCNEEGVE